MRRGGGRRPGPASPSVRRRRARCVGGWARAAGHHRGGAAAVGVAPLAMHPMATPVDHLYPEPHSPLFDFEATRRGAEWIDDLASTALMARDSDETAPVVAHTDWSARNVRVWPDGIRAIYDADSLSLVPESTAVGIAAATWSAFGEAGEPIGAVARRGGQVGMRLRARGSTLVRAAATCSGRSDPPLARLHGAVRARVGGRASRARTPAAGARPVGARRRPLRRPLRRGVRSPARSVPRHDLAHPTRNDGAVRRPAARATSEVRGARRPRLHRCVVRRVRRR